MLTLLPVARNNLSCNLRATRAIFFMELRRAWVLSLLEVDRWYDKFTRLTLCTQLRELNTPSHVVYYELCNLFLVSLFCALLIFLRDAFSSMIHRNVCHSCAQFAFCSSFVVVVCLVVFRTEARQRVCNSRHNSPPNL